MFKSLWSQIKITLISSVCFFSLTNNANADSPLTSTDLATAYQDLAIIQQAKNSQVLQGEVLNFLLSDAPLDQKAAVINALGWNTDGQNNGYLFVIGLAKNKGIRLENLRLFDLTASDRFVLGYLLAMDDYFDLSPLNVNANKNKPLWWATPLQLLSQATYALPDNFTVHFVTAIVEAQLYLDNSWCAVYQSPQLVLKLFPPSQRNLRPTAVQNSLDYLNDYAEYCE